MPTTPNPEIPEQAIVVYIVGPTASGKTNLAIDLAWAPRSQILCLDKRTVVNGMDIGTAKPTSLERRRVTHHMINQVTTADTQLTENQLRQIATKTINELLDMDILIPFVVSGSANFVEDMVYDNKREPVDPAFLAALSKKSLRDLLQLCEENGYGKPFLLDDPSKTQDTPSKPEDQIIDKQRAIRHILHKKFDRHKRTKPARGTLLLGIEQSETTRNVAIEARTSSMLERGLATEVTNLLKETNGQWTDYLKNTLGYREFLPYFTGQASLEDVKQNINTNTKRYGRWQETAFATSIPDIHWVKNLSEAERALKAHIVKVVNGDDYLAWLRTQRWADFLGIDALPLRQVRRRVIECYAYHMEKAKAVIFDIDGTLSPEMSWLALTRDLGASVETHKQIYADYKAGSIDYAAARGKLLELWRSTGNATKANFQRIFENWPLDPHAERLIALARRDNRAVCLITGSMDLYAQTIAKRLNIPQWYANTTLHWDQKGNLIDMDYELHQADRKIEQFGNFCRKRGIQPQECIVVGDDEIDLGLFAASRRGILVGTDRSEEHIQQAWKTASTLADVERILTEVDAS